MAVYYRFIKTFCFILVFSCIVWARSIAIPEIIGSNLTPAEAASFSSDITEHVIELAGKNILSGAQLESSVGHLRLTLLDLDNLPTIMTIGKLAKTDFVLCCKIDKIGDRYIVGFALVKTNMEEYAFKTSEIVIGDSTQVLSRINNIMAQIATAVPILLDRQDMPRQDTVVSKPALKPVEKAKKSAPRQDTVVSKPALKPVEKAKKPEKPHAPYLIGVQCGYLYGGNSRQLGYGLTMAKNLGRNSFGVNCILAGFGADEEGYYGGSLFYSRELIWFNDYLSGYAGLDVGYYFEQELMEWVIRQYVKTKKLQILFGGPHAYLNIKAGRLLVIPRFTLFIGTTLKPMISIGIGMPFGRITTRKPL